VSERRFEVAAIKTDRCGTAIVDAADYRRVRRQRWYYSTSGPYRQVRRPHWCFRTYRVPQSLLRFVAQTEEHVAPINGDWWDARRANIRTRGGWRPLPIREMDAALARVRTTVRNLQQGGR
jgi:hypothetical protein